MTKHIHIEMTARKSTVRRNTGSSAHYTEREVLVEEVEEEVVVKMEVVMVVEEVRRW